MQSWERESNIWTVKGDQEKFDTLKDAIYDTVESITQGGVAIEGKRAWVRDLDTGDTYPVDLERECRRYGWDFFLSQSASKSAEE